MVLSKTFLPLLFIALSTADASSLIHRDGGKGILAFSARLRLDKAANGGTLSERDRARAHAFMRENSLSSRSVDSVSIVNDIVSYTAEVGIGEPPHNYTLLIDTGSSNTWVGANKTNPYVRTKTSIDTGNSFSISYGDTDVLGEEFLDTITLSPDLVIKNQSIGVANRVNGSTGVDGFLGVGPVALTVHTVNNTTTVPTVMDNLHSQGTISEEVLGIYFVPTAENVSTGELMFGGYDSSVITSPLEYVSLTTTGEASLYWGVNQSVFYDGEIIQSNATGYIDTGSTLILLETEAFRKYQNATGAVLDEDTGLLAIDAAQYARLKPLSFKIGDVCLDLTPNAQIWPRTLNVAIGGNASAIYLVVGDTGEFRTTSGIDFVNGYALLQRYYSVYDALNKRVGFAKTNYTNSVIN